MSIYEHGYPEMDEEVFMVNEELHQALDVLKDHLWEEAHKSVKESYDKLLKENIELRSLKVDIDAIKSDYVRKSRELEAEKVTLDYEKNNMEQIVRNERVSELFKDREIIMYVANYERVLGDKCDNCDEDRELSFDSPRGVTLKENCACSDYVKKYSPKALIRYKFSVLKDTQPESVYYRQWYEDSDELDHDWRIDADSVYDGNTEFESLNSTDVFFNNESDCMAYCVYLNGLNERIVSYNYGK